VARGRKQREGIQRVDVTGNAANLWAKFQPKLIDAVERFLATPVNPDTGATLREEAQEIASLALNNLKARLRKDTIENAKNEAEIAEIYERLEHERVKESETRAKTRKLNAEAEAQETENAIRRLRVALRLTKVMLAGQPGEEAILFGKKIEAYLKALEDFSEATQKGP
jgi:archaellum component FlaD/FlaE